jgi:hypothetical protein
VVLQYNTIQVQFQFRPYVGGVVGPVNGKKRVGKRYELDAFLNLTEFTKRLINPIVVYNTQHVIEGYDLASAMQGSRDDHFHCAAFPQQLAIIRGTAAHPLLKLVIADST